MTKIKYLRIILFVNCFYASIQSELVIDPDIKKHLKLIKDKPTQDGLLNIDYIYMINLEQNTDRWKTSLSELQRYGIKPFRFSAINGWELSVDAINDIGVKYESWMDPIIKKGISDLGVYWSSITVDGYTDIIGYKWPKTNPQGFPATCYLPEQQLNLYENSLDHRNLVTKFGEIPNQSYFTHDYYPGQIGCALSHLSILQDAYDCGYEIIWVLEDDIVVTEDPHQLSDLISELNTTVGENNWDILFTDQDHRHYETGEYLPCKSFAYRPNFYPENTKRFSMRYQVSKNIDQIGARYSTASMIIKRSGIKKLLNFIYKYQLFLPIDMEMTLPNDIKLFCSRKDIVSQSCGKLGNIAIPPGINNKD